jgi:hypothetical protein
MKIDEWLTPWETEVATMIRDVVLPTENEKTTVDADEVCFFGSVCSLPRSMEYLKSIGTVEIKPEIYVVGVKDGTLIPPNIWFASQTRERLEMVTDKLMRKMTELMEFCDDEGFIPPSAVKTAVIVSTGEAYTKYEFDRLPSPPYTGMSAADWAFDEWVTRIGTVGSAFLELHETTKRN